MNKWILSGTLALLVIIGGYYVWPKNQMDIAELVSPETAALVTVLLPETFSENAKLGKRFFDMKCANCHGINAVGQDGVAPPLVHIIYEPNHHGDESFQRAAARGVKAHHWKFGDMPPVEGVTRGDLKMIITYIRELQRANGIN